MARAGSRWGGRGNLLSPVRKSVRGYNPRKIFENNHAFWYIVLAICHCLFRNFKDPRQNISDIFMNFNGYLTLFLEIIIIITIIIIIIIIIILIIIIIRIILLLLLLP